ncbi:MAG: hypothetical protein JO114_11140 [Planctomycetaceae bacterium]|nr:hypothetical protein [Planctomycetaceae bacterium]
MATFLVSASLSHAFRESAVQRQRAAHVPENILDRVQELGDIGLKEAANGTDPESTNPGQFARIDNHTTVTETMVKLGELERWICGWMKCRDDEALDLGIEERYETKTLHTGHERPVIGGSGRSPV